MSKWNKTEKPLTEQFLQNQQRRRQMIIQASKKRRERQKKLQQINQNLKKNQQQALEKHKKQKQQAYNKYLKNNNMHDKYEQMKRNQKIQEEPKRDVSKWKRKESKEKTQTKTIQGLDLQKSHGKTQLNDIPKVQANKQKDSKVDQKKKAVADQFQKQWAQQHDEKEISQQMLGSKLIDSLDLDLDTVQRGRQLTNKIEKIKQKKQQFPLIITKDVDDLRKIIGYDSMLVSIDNCTQKQSQKQSKKQIVSNDKIDKKIGKHKQVPQKKQTNQQQTFNNLKHKKQAKILQWACNQAEEADDLFSNCSSKKNLSKNVQQNKGSKKLLEPIPQKPSSKNKSIQKQRKANSSFGQQNVSSTQERRSFQINKSNASAQRLSNVGNTSKQRKQINSDKKIEKIKQSNQPSSNGDNKNRSLSKQKPKQSLNAFEREKQKSLQKLRQRKFSGDRGGSMQKNRRKPQQNNNQKLPKTQQQFRAVKNAAPIPSVPRPAYTVATQEQQFDVQSFIRNDLLQLNEQQRKIQQQLRNIHMKNKQKVKQIQSKYEIKTDYKNTANLIKKQEYGEESQVQLGGYGAQYSANLNEDLIQDSIQRLDDLLIKRQIKSRQKTNVISEQSHLKSQYKSIIDPLGRPEDLQRQILQLAENISKFQNQVVEDAKGYGYQRKMKKKQQANKNYIPQQILSQSKNIEDVRKPEPKKNFMKMPNPPILQYSGKNNQIREVDLDERDYDDAAEDSLDTMQKQKIKVNQKLKNILFD